MNDTNQVKQLRCYNSDAMLGSMNMAVDELLANSLAESPDFGYLRFYKWQPACLSFGYNQSLKNILHFEALKDHNIDVVRRASGGKMVYHDKEYTFSVGLPVVFLKNILGANASFIDMFQFTMQPIIDCLCGLGVPARFSTAKEILRTNENRVHCYASVAGHSIFAGDRKLIGAAGFFKGGCLIIHGSIPIIASFPPTNIFITGGEAITSIEMASLSGFITCSDILLIPNLMAKYFADVLILPVKEFVLTPNEIQQAEQLCKEKYANPTWTNLK